MIDPTQEPLNPMPEFKLKTPIGTFRPNWDKMANMMMMWADFQENRNYYMVFVFTGLFFGLAIGTVLGFILGKVF